MPSRLHPSSSVSTAKSTAVAPINAPAKTVHPNSGQVTSPTRTAAMTDPASNMSTAAVP
ncbi:hypothetical protein [Streptomyces odontomachi]|uniref:hypothetical protein n=1 Tax=Streptomyces odontomachi TaxID=2944940 RepID=UPI00210DE156|nr:hypothetical protein [Streptomyces sp. ODS25]